MDAENEFVKRVRSGERVRCALVAGPGGFGKSTLADRVVEQLAVSEIGATYLTGSAGVSIEAIEDPDRHDVLIVDEADSVDPAVLTALRVEALKPSSATSLLVLARRATAVPELAELAALADRDDFSARLSPMSSDVLQGQVASSADGMAAQVGELTGAIPLWVDRLCGGWSATDSWPQGQVSSADELPDRFVDTVEVQLARLSVEQRMDLAERSLSSIAGVDPSSPRKARPLVDAGLANGDGSIPLGVAFAVQSVITQDELDAATRAVGCELVQTDPGLAVGLLDGSNTALSWTAAALAASGQIDRASKVLDRIANDGALDGAALGAAAQVAAMEARWGEAARLASEIDEHPYWSEAKTAAVAQLYATLDLNNGPLADAGQVPTSPESMASFLAGAISAMSLTMSPETDSTALAQQLRELTRQAPNQQPMLDVAVTGTELAALAALVSGDFEVARTLMKRSPEAAGRSDMNAALQRWISLRAGDVSALDDAPEPDENDLFLPGVLRLAGEVMSSRRSGEIAKQADVLQAIVELGSVLSVDLVTFDALCELHLGAHRLDARREAREIAAGLDEFVSRLGSPVLWDVRRLWNQLESAIAAGDAAAVADAAKALTDRDGAAEAAPSLVAAAIEWAAVFDGSSKPDDLHVALGGLESSGYLWEAAALAGQAAIRTTDGAHAKELLQRGREFRQATPTAKPTSPAGLSEREIEIGLLVLAGHSYKEIGATCFISPKTVEHHIAHIRQKLSAVGVSRAEFRAALEADLAE